MRAIPIAAAIAVAACGRGAGADRPAELAACQLISKSGDALAECLVMKYSWRAESAGPAKYDWQRHLDSLRRGHEEQIALLIAAQEDEQRRAEAARRDSLARVAAPWSRCITRQWREHGSNWSFLPCRSLPRPDRVALDAYLGSRRFAEGEVGVLNRAHMASGFITP